MNPSILFENNGIFIAIGLILLLVFISMLWRKTAYPYTPRKTLLTEAEKHFFMSLKKALPGGEAIALKVRLGDIITCSDHDWAKGYGPRISAKHIDFVLYHPLTTNILLCIELDDSSHQRADRKRRDAFVDSALKAANVPLLRVRAANQYDTSDLQQNIKHHLEIHDGRTS